MYITGTTGKLGSSLRSNPESEAVTVQRAIASGIRDRNQLTDLVFHRRHRELGGQPLVRSHPRFTVLLREWIEIRDWIVSPALCTFRAVATGSEVTPAIGTIERIEHEMNKIIGDPAEAPRWGYDGNLDDRLAIRRFMDSREWAPMAPFRKANYAKANKCNVFALDLSWRCGFSVPVLRYKYDRHGVRHTYPLANQLTTFANRASRRGASELVGVDDAKKWGSVESGATVRDTNASIDGGAFYILVGWSQTGTGHVGVIRQIEDIKKNSSGEIQSITYDGWEATRARAECLVGRNWRVVTTPPRSDRSASHTFGAIHIIRLTRQPDPAQRAVRVAHVDKMVLG